MSLLQYVTDRRNRIKVGGGVGLLLSAAVAGASLLQGENLAGRVTWGFDASGNQYMSGSLLTKSGATATLHVDTPNARVGVGRLNPRTALEVQGTISGSALFISGMTDCDNATSSKLLYDLTTNRFSCGSDQAGGGGGASTGALQTAFDGRYVNTSGDTMTGALKVRANISGSTLRIDGLQSCDTIDTNAQGVSVCGTDNTGTDSADDLSNNTTSDLAEGSNLYFLNERVDDRVDALLAVSGYLAKSYNDGGDALTLTGLSWSGTGALQLRFDGRYLRTAGGTVTGSLVVQGTISGAHLFAGTMSGAGLVDCDTAGTSKLLWDATTRKFSCGTDTDTDTNTTYTAGHGLALVGTRFQTASALTGTTIQALTALRSSGSLSVERWGAFQQLTSCDSIDTTSTGMLICGTDASGGGGSVNTGAIATVYDGKYVNIGGDTMTGSLSINVTGGNQATLGLRVINTASGAHFHAEKTLSTSGTLVFEGAATGATLYVATSIQGSGLVDCDLATQTLAWDASTGRFSCGSDSDTTYTAAQGLTLLAGNAFRLNDTISGSLLEFQTVSGSVVYGNTLRSSGSVVWEGSASGASLWLSKLEGAGLTDCDGDTQALSWDATTKRFVCGDDDNSGGGGGLSGAEADGKYVNIGGDTMTGGLLIKTDTNPLSIEASDGDDLFLLSAGSFRAMDPDENDFFRTENSPSLTDMKVTGFDGGGQFYVGFQEALRTLEFTDPNDNNLLNVTWTPSVLDFVVGTETGGILSILDDAAGAIMFFADEGSEVLNVTRVQGTSNTLTLTDHNGIAALSVMSNSAGTIAEVPGTISGAAVYGKNTLRSSGSLVWEGSASGALLWVSSFDGAGLADCDTAGTSKLLWDSTLKRFSCGTDQNTGGTAEVGTLSFSGAVKVISNPHYVNVGGDTMTGALAINVTSGTINTLGLRVINTFSGAIVQATQQLRSSGTLITESGASFDGNTLHVAAGPNRVGIGTTSPRTALEVLGTMSGVGLRITGTGATPILATQGGALGMGTDVPSGDVKLDIMGGSVRPLDLETTGNDYFNLIRGAGDRKWTIGALSSNQTFFLYDDDAGQRRFEILNSGEVGIGQGAATTKAKLTIAGTASGSRVTISSQTAGASGSLVIHGADGARICMRDTDGVGWTVITGNNGTVSGRIATGTECNM